MLYIVVFFFKQKTAYEMRISDWSSDVCSSDLRIIRPDLAGSARSTEAPKDLSIENHVESLVHILDALGIEKAHVLANSMGTIVAQHLAVNHPSRVGSLALFGPLLAPPEAAREPTRKRAQLSRTGATGMQEIADAIAQGATSKQTKDERPAVIALVRESIMRQPAEGYALNCEALAKAQAADIKNRSEEHTSELQSLMRISYAVFCLNKK